MSRKNLLVELFVEELPPKALRKLGDAFAAAVSDAIKIQGLAEADAAVMSFASPRRLAVHIADVATHAADKPVTHKLMPVNVGLDANGQATPALLKRLATLGLDGTIVPHLKRASDGKSEALFHDSVVKGATLTDGLQKALDEALGKLPIPKMMAYQLHENCAQPGWSTVNFVRPVHGLVALHGTEVVPVSALGLNAGRATQGHRFEAAVGTVSLKSADSYAAQMENEGAVIASFEARRADIVRQLQDAADKIGGVTPVADEALLDEVTGLVERPNVLVGCFGEEFLGVPQECLILTMKANQKYFPLLDASGKLTNQFLIVSNISPADTSAVIGGNERVVRPRLADAKFFFDQDRKKTLESRVLGLAKVVYHNKLGTQGERVQRVCAIAKAIGEQLSGKTLALKAEQAALLSKADLLTDMVGEFPELQGIMGRYYALNDGLPAEIADAIEDHYKPRFSGDELPCNQVGLCVALADKLETLVGLFGIGQLPTGDKDPFALRRHALGVIRILIEKELPLEVGALVDQCCLVMDEMLENGAGSKTLGVEGAAFAPNLAPETSPVSRAINDFFQDRLAGFLREKGFTFQEVDAVLSLHPQLLAEIPKRLAAVHAFAKLPEAASLAAANKRIQNILKKAGEIPAGEPDPALLAEDAEKALFAAVNQLAPNVFSAVSNGSYTEALTALAGVRAEVDTFFDKVMVMAEELPLRNNRLALLRSLGELMNQVADISKLAA
ncbi:MAG: glycine--tRNA ligase subunit beta [Sulfuricella sp.]|nr:glycine--tRNA ligase subunit beta [Sulfuricella sp.]